MTIPLRQRLRDAYNAERKWPQPAPEPSLREIAAHWSANRRANDARIDAIFARLMRERGLR